MRKPYTRASAALNGYHAFKDEHLTVSCPACGASRGGRCKGKYGVASKGTHIARIDRLREIHTGIFPRGVTMKSALRITVMLLLCMGIAASAQTPTLSLNLGPAGFNCGRVSTPTYCYGIPVAATDDDGTTTGSIWVDQQSSGYGFVLFNDNFEGLGQATIRSPFQPLSTKGGSLNYQITGTDGETGKPYGGMLTLTYTSYYSSGGGGRGGGGAGWRFVVNGGSININE